ncbi:MAG TPA: hypothetical protein VNN72_29845 [Polyangiaceae bacterium]|nr:hypothetical protein [Polyangiaceae bacterium]
MSSRGVVVLFPRIARKQSLGARVQAGLADVLTEVLAFERTHARLAWSVTAVGLVIGLALQSL